MFNNVYQTKKIFCQGKTHQITNALLDLILEEFSTLNLYDQDKTYSFYRKYFWSKDLEPVITERFEFLCEHGTAHHQTLINKVIENKDILDKLTSDCLDEDTYEVVNNFDDYHYFLLTQIKKQFKYTSY
jgi:hypothetical protein